MKTSKNARNIFYHGLISFQMNCINQKKISASNPRYKLLGAYFVLFVYILTSDQRLKTKTSHRIGRLLLQEVMRPKAVLSVLLVYFLYQFLTDRLKGHMPCIEPLKG